MSEPYQEFVAGGSYKINSETRSFNGMFRRFLDGKLIGAMKGGALVFGTMNDKQMNFIKLGKTSAICTLEQRPPNDYAGTLAMISPERERAIWTDSLPELNKTHGIKTLPEVLDILAEIQRDKIEAHLDRDSIEKAKRAINPAQLTLLEVSAMRY